MTMEFLLEKIRELESSLTNYIQQEKQANLAQREEELVSCKQMTMSAHPFSKQNMPI